MNVNSGPLTQMAKSRAERTPVLDALWKTPARLLRRSAIDNGLSRVSSTREVASGLLEEMLKLASTSSEAEASLLIIESRLADEPLTWPEILSLLAEPTFPIEI